MTTTEWYILIVILFLIVIVYYLSIYNDKEYKKQKGNIIELQNDGYDYILYKGKIKEMINDYHHYLSNMDIIIYSKGIFIGMRQFNKVYLQLSADAIQSVRCDIDKIIIKCYTDYQGISNIELRGISNKQMSLMVRKINFILKRAKRIANNTKKIKIN